MDSTDALIHTLSGAVSDLEPSTTETLSLDWTAPPYAGTYYYAVCTRRYDFRGCSAAVRVTVEGSEGGSPDLAGEITFVSNNSVTPGTSISFHTQEKNIGTGPAAPTTRRVYRSENANIEPTDTQIGFAIGRTPSTRRRNRWRWHTTPMLRSRRARTTMASAIDPTIGETNADNNCSNGVPITVEASRGDGADLIVVGLSTFNHNPATGEFLLWASVQNIGSGPAAASTYRFYRSEDANIEPTDTQVRSSKNTCTRRR